MTNAFDLYKEANRLVREYNTRDPMKIAQELGIRVFYSNELGNLLGLYTYMIRNRVVKSSRTLLEPLKKREKQRKTAKKRDRIFACSRVLRVVLKIT